MRIEKEILKKIQEHSTIIIHRHQRPDPDALGSQGGLAEILTASFPDKKIYQVGGPVGDLSYLTEMKTVEDEVYQDALVIVTDTANAPRISDNRYDQGAFLIKMDHHPDDEPYGDLSWVNTDASSSSEVIYDFYKANENDLVMTDEAARLLYAGIVGDTGRFLYPSTTSHTLQVASELVAYQFDASKLNRQIDEISFKVAKLAGYVLQEMKADENGACMVFLPQSILTQYGVTDAETAALISLPGKVEDIIAWGIFVEQPEGFFRVRLRSKGPAINQIAKAHHGGGHPLASGANAEDKEEALAIYGEIQELVKNWH